MVAHRADLKATGVARFQAPVHPLHPAVGERESDQLKFLITNGGECFSDSLDRAVKFTDAPPASILRRRHVTDVSLAAAQINEGTDPLLKRSITEMPPVLIGFFVSLLHEQGAQHLGGEALG